jgi:Arc/MetJ-type ribon-helix-helix transcriptional regulator
MKLSVSLPDDDVAELDRFAESAGLPSRSAAVSHAIRLLRTRGLEDQYAAAWSEWESDGEAAAWEPVTGDGLGDASR